mgnify:CR=1 FL=1
MATTRLMPLHVGKGRTAGTAIAAIIDYVENPEKTDNGKLITSWQCDSRVGIHAHQQVVHGGIRADAQPQDAPGANMGGLAEVRNNGRQRLLDDGVLEPFPAAGLALLDNSVDDVRAVADLAVAGGAFCQQLAADQIGQNHSHRGGADIDGAADNRGVLRSANLHTAEGIVQKFALHAHVEAIFP